MTFSNGLIYDSHSGKQYTLEEAVKQINIYIYKNWQAQWVSSQKGKTTFRFFPSVEDKMKVKHIEINYFTTQIFSGHGNFAQYLQRFSLVNIGLFGK